MKKKTEVSLVEGDTSKYLQMNANAIRMRRYGGVLCPYFVLCDIYLYYVIHYVVVILTNGVYLFTLTI